MTHAESQGNLCPVSLLLLAEPWGAPTLAWYGVLSHKPQRCTSWKHQGQVCHFLVSVYTNYLQRFGNNYADLQGFPGGAVVKNLPANRRNTRDVGLILGFGRYPGEGNGNTLQYSCLENSMDRGAWWATVCGGGKLRVIHTHTHTHTCRFKLKTSFLKKKDIWIHLMTLDYTLKNGCNGGISLVV